MNPTVTPTTGRIVRFNADQAATVRLNQLGSTKYHVGDEVPGMIVRVLDNQACNLKLFPDADESIRVINVPFSAQHQPGTWGWPERTEQIGSVAA